MTVKNYLRISWKDVVTNEVRKRTMLQAAQLLQRDRATLRVIEYFAKSPKVTQDNSK